MGKKVNSCAELCAHFDSQKDYQCKIALGMERERGKKATLDVRERESDSSTKNDLHTPKKETQAIKYAPSLFFLSYYCCVSHHHHEGWPINKSIFHHDTAASSFYRVCYFMWKIVSFIKCVPAFLFCSRISVWANSAAPRTTRPACAATLTPTRLQHRPPPRLQWAGPAPFIFETVCSVLPRWRRQ